MIQGEIEKACQIFETAVKEYNILDLPDADPLLAPSNLQLSCLIFNYIKCNSIRQAGQYMSSDAYSEGGLQQGFLRNDQLSVKLFTILTKMQSPMAKGFFEERQEAENKFDLALKQIQ